LRPGALQRCSPLVNFYQKSMTQLRSAVAFSRPAKTTGNGFVHRLVTAIADVKEARAQK